MTDVPHMLAMLSDTKMRTGYTSLPSCTVVDSSALWINVILNEFAHCSTASPLWSVVVYPHVVLVAQTSYLVVCTRNVQILQAS